MSSSNTGLLGKITEYSVPLIAGVVASLIAANTVPDWYRHVVEAPWASWLLLGHEINLDFVINDIFMVLFFGVAAKEITDAILPGGALSPMKKAINPLLGTVGGIVGPAGLYVLLAHALYSDPAQQAAVANGWAVPTATDIALAWLAARLVFGAGHPAVSFLLLLAIADDAIGLVIIAVFYPDPAHPVHLMSLLYTGGGMALAYALRRVDVRVWWPYIALAGGLSWYGLITAHLHPALALVPIVPFLPKRLPVPGLIGDPEPAFAGDPVPEMVGTAAASRAEWEDARARRGISTLDNFEHAVKPTVDWGLFLFAFANAGVPFSNLGTTTWIVLASLVVGKTVGIGLCSWAAELAGFPLPAGMTRKDLGVAGLVAGLGLTVALFVCGVAFTDPALQAEAKMGALFSGGVFVLALVVARAIGVRPASPPD